MIVEFFSAEIEFNVWKIDTSYYCIVGDMRKLMMIMMAMMMRRRRMRRVVIEDVNCVNHTFLDKV